MFSWKGFVAIVLATYLFLITLFFATSEKKLYGNACMHRDACVRFCCIDENLCTDKFIQTHFNSSKVLEIEGREDLVIKTRFGKPQCPLPLTLLEPAIPQFTPNEYIRRTEDLKGYPFHYDLDVFCVESQNSIGDDTEVWDIWYCKNPKEVRMTIHNYLMAAAWIFIATTLVAYVTSKSFDTVAGRCEFMLLLGLLLFYIAYPLFDNDMLKQPELVFNTLLIAFALIFFWMTVLTFDIWWTFRKQIKTQDVSRMFNVYCYYVFGCIGSMILLELANRARIQALTATVDSIALVFHLALVALSVAVIVLLLLTGFMVAQFSKSSDTIDQAWFEAQKERYWSYLGVYFVLLITWPFGIWLTGGPEFSFGQRVAVDFMKFSSALFIFFILGCRKLVISIRRYFNQGDTPNEEFV